MAFRIASAAMAAVFALAIAVQYNDPDPLVWMLAYAIPCALSVAAAAQRDWPAAAGALCAAYALAALLSLPSLLAARAQAFTHWHMLSAEDESAREAAGLGLCALWLGVLGLRGRAR